MNNAVLILSGMIFCFNIIINVFIQIDFGYILRESTIGSGNVDFGDVMNLNFQSTESGTGEILVFN